MKIDLVSVFTCDFCGKKQFRKSDMTKHEKWCKKRPENDHICFHYCQHLEKDREEIEGTGDYDIPPQTRTIFTCKALGKKLYSFKAEKRGIVKFLENCERMPLTCDSYKDRIEYFE